MYDIIYCPIHSSVLTERWLLLVLLEQSGLMCLSKQPVPKVLFSEKFSPVILIVGTILCVYGFAGLKNKNTSSSDQDSITISEICWQVNNSTN